MYDVSTTDALTNSQQIAVVDVEDGLSGYVAGDLQFVRGLRCSAVLVHRLAAQVLGEYVHIEMELLFSEIETFSYYMRLIGTEHQMRLGRWLLSTNQQ